MKLNTINIVNETPAGSQAKYKYDKEKGIMVVKKLLPAGMRFPYDFGFIPGTKGEDGDPIDTMVIAEFSTFPGCYIESRLIGVLLAEQEEEKKKIRNDRYFFVPEHSLLFKDIKSLEQLSGEHLEQLTDFFINYNKAEGKKFTPLGIEKPAQAWKMLKEQMD